MVPLMRDIGRLIRRMEKVASNTQMVIFMMENGLMTELVVMEFSSIIME